MIAAPSPNHNSRKLPVSILVLHYTGMTDGPSALARMCDPEAEVSAHYMVEEDGRVFRLVDEDQRAWHAGRSEWNGITDINSASVGIEIVNGGHEFGLPDFPTEQIDALIPLCQRIVNEYAITPRNIVGHSDIAPERKDDPGEKFPWQRLADAGLGLWPGEGNGDGRILFESGDRDRGVALMQRALSGIGYGVEIDGVMTDRTVAIVRAFQRRFRPDGIDGSVDMETYDLIARIARMI